RRYSEVMYNVLHDSTGVLHRGGSISRMIRKQIYLEPGQEHLLKQRANELGVSEAELIRRCLATMGPQTVPLPLEPQAWADELAFRRRGPDPAPSRPARGAWTREALYADGLGRFFL